MENKNNPWLFELSVVEGCNRCCLFCGYFEYKKIQPKIKFVNLKLVKEIAKSLFELKPNIRINFSTFGEPFLHPNFDKIIEIFRKYLPNSYISTFTNCDLLLDKNKNLEVKKILHYFNCGLNHIGLDCYDSRDQLESYEKNLSKIKEKVIVQKFPNELKFPLYFHNGKNKRIITLIPCYIKQKGIRKRHNMGGNVNTKLANNSGENILTINDSLEKFCVRPFRDLIMKYDGKVVICCNDWKNEQVIGEFPQNSLKEIWNGKEFNKIRVLLQNKIRGFIPCSKCSYFGGTRQGFIKKIEIGKDKFKSIKKEFCIKDNKNLLIYLK